MKFLISFVHLCSLVLIGLFPTSFSKQEVLTLKTKHGVYDCVDFYKQPAFIHHPLLKNLTFKKKRLPNLAKLQSQKLVDGFGLEGGGCPMGTVPILRVNLNASNLSPPPSLPYNDTAPNLCVAVVETRNGDYPSKKFYGVSAAITNWKPKVAHSQWSSARIKLKREGESIEAGWMVNPDLYNDFEAHLYAQLLSYSAKCVSPCTAFVQVSKQMPLGMIPHHYSQIKEKINWLWKLSIEKHRDDESWWLTITDNQYKIGYWPKEALTYLQDVAEQVDWGGEVNTGPKDIMPPEMGSGIRASYDGAITASIRRMKVVNSSFESVEPRETTKVWNEEARYDVKDGGYRGEDFGRIMYYGGPSYYSG